MRSKTSKSFDGESHSGPRGEPIRFVDYVLPRRVKVVGSSGDSICDWVEVGRLVPTSTDDDRVGHLRALPGIPLPYILLH